MRSNLPELCSNPSFLGVAVYDKWDVYFFTPNRTYILNGRTNEPDLNHDSMYGNIRPNLVEPHKRWKQFDPKCNHFWGNGDQLCEIRDKVKYVCWDKNGNPKGKDIGDYSPPPKDMKPDGDPNAGHIDVVDGKYWHIRDQKVGYIDIKDKGPVMTTGVKPQQKYPKGTVGVIPTSDDVYYVIRNDGKYCKILDPNKREVFPMS